MIEEQSQGDVEDNVSASYTCDISDPMYITEILNPLGLDQTSRTYQNALETATIANSMFTEALGETVNGPLRRYAILKAIESQIGGNPGLQYGLLECSISMVQGLEGKGINKDTIDKSLK